jgi:hypothetical protein
VGDDDPPEGRRDLEQALEAEGGEIRGVNVEAG